jgi:hypothetical protein
MNETVVTVLSGIGLLIFAYLLFNNASGVTSILNASFTGGNKTISTLQGRK